MSKDRFTAIQSSLSCDWKRLFELLRVSWSSAIDPGGSFAIDEAMFSFQSKDEHCPKRYIPRKPHPNGLLAYVAALKTSCGAPYVFDIEGDVDVDKMNPRSALLAMMERFPWPHLTPHVAIDAGFSGEESMKILLDKGVFFTSAVNTNHKRWLHDLLSRNCPTNSWLAARDSHGVVWSIKNTGEKCMFLASNAFHCDGMLQEIVEDPPITEADRDHLAKLSNRALFCDCRSDESPPRRSK